MQPKFIVEVDGVETTLTFDSHSGSRGYQYLTPGAGGSYAFPFQLETQIGAAFRTGGHAYKIVRQVQC